MSERVYKEPTKEELIEDTKKYLKYLDEELRKAKSYWKKLTIKQDIATNVRILKLLLENKDE